MIKPSVSPSLLQSHLKVLPFSQVQLFMIVCCYVCAPFWGPRDEGSPFSGDPKISCHWCRMVVWLHKTNSSMRVACQV